jgi:structural maintenance of chromosome 4
VKGKHERFRPAFYSVLQNTLVAKDLEQANRIAYGAKRWRVVTLDGQLIDKSGTMSGGGTKVAKGGMSSKLAADTSKEQVAKLEVDRDALEQEYTQLQESKSELEAEMKRLQAEIPKLDTQAQKLLSLTALSVISVMLRSASKNSLQKRSRPSQRRTRSST